MNTPTLRTERLILRRFAENDLGALLLIFGDEEVNRFLPWYPLRDMHDARRFYEERYASKYARVRGYDYAICLKADNIPIGYVNVYLGEAHDLGFGLRKEFWHRGIVTEATKAVVEQARRDGLPFVTATHDVNNPRSGNVMRNLGMEYRYTYEEQWQPKDIPVLFRMYQLNFDEDDRREYRGYWDRSRHRYVEEL